MEIFLSYIFGGFAMGSLFFAYQKTDRRQLITCKLCADVSWTLHYFFLGAYGGMIPNLVGIFREIIFSHRETWRFADNKIWVAVILVANWSLGILTFKEPINILPIVASSMVTVSLWLKKPKLTKIILVPVCLTYLVYNIVVGSYIGAANESLSLLSLAISLFRTRTGAKKTEKKSLFTSPCPGEKPIVTIGGAPIDAPLAAISVAEDPLALVRGEVFADAVDRGFFADFEKTAADFASSEVPVPDQMVHVSTFRVIGDKVYMTYYANTQAAQEDPNHQTARLCICPVEDPSQKTFIDLQTVGDDCGGKTVEMVYDTIFAQKDDDTLMLLWTAKVGGMYYRLYRTYTISTGCLGKVGVNRFRVGNVENDFSTEGIRRALAENDEPCKRMFSDIGIMQKFTCREEDGEKWYYTGTYSGDYNAIIKSRDFITWTYVAAPDFPNLSKWENATYVIGDICYYFVRQHDETPWGFLTTYDLTKRKWSAPVLVSDCQSRADFVEYEGQLYLFHAPIDREHIGVLRINKEHLEKSTPVLCAHIHSSCFYPFVWYFGDELAMSYTVDRKHIRLSRFSFGEIVK